MNEELRDELLRRKEEEQRLRSEWVERPDDAQLVEHIAEIDAQNIAWLEKIIEEQGFPGLSDVNEDGIQALFLLIQHSPSLAFQKKCLPLMEQAVQKGESAPGYVAYLTDRILLHEEKPQIYGTQCRSLENGEIGSYPIEDEEHVNERRQAIGFDSIEEYLKQMNEIYKTKK